MGEKNEAPGGRAAGQAELDENAGNHRIFLVRHGETDWNRTYRYQGTSDIALNETGLEQARRTALRLSSVVPDRIWASPLVRARRTAELIAERSRADVPVELDPDLVEVSFGKWEGLSTAEVAERDAETLIAWRRSPFSVVPEGGEPPQAVFERAERVAKRLAQEGGAGEASFVVAHGAVLRALLAALMRVTDRTVLWRMRFDNCSIAILDLWGPHPSLMALNDTYHLRLENDEAIAALPFPS
jgi:Fructose-2,6-bisphosphatase